MHLVADGILVAARRSNDEVEWLLSGRAGTLRHDVEQLAVGLAQQFIEDTGVDVVAVFRGDLGGQRLIDGACRQVDEALLALHDLDALEQGRALEHHVLCHIEYDAGLCAVVGAAVDFTAFFLVGTEHIQRDGSGQLALSGLLADFNKGGIELPVAIGLEDTEDIPDDLFLPFDELEGFPCPGAFGVAQALDEVHRIIRCVLIVDGVLGLELRGLVFLQLSQIITSDGHKK